MFHTQVVLPTKSLQFSHEDKLLAMGSCFAENIGAKLSNAFFPIQINPFGVLYNPISIADSLESLLEDKVYSQHDIFEYKSLWQSLSFSSLYADVSPEQCLRKMNDSVQEARSLLSECKVLLITFGTAWVFEDVKSGLVVANCHKLPASNFFRRRISVEEIVQRYTLLFNRLHAQLPNLRVVFSVSPIRHWKDGAHENTISKSSLHLAISDLQNQYDWVEYFPAYEILMDELRDYRFYASDMFHPSEMAVDYIWQKFSAHYFSDQTQALVKRLAQLTADLSHRPLHPQSSDYQLFVAALEKKKNQLCEEFPFLRERIMNSERIQCD